MTTVDAQIRERARALGFDRVGVAAADEPIEPQFGRYEAFVDAGMHGEMAYLASAREARRRLDTERILAGAKSVICVAESYGGRDEQEELPGVAGQVARYARGSDYHNHLRRRLRKLAAFVRTLGEGVEARPICDDAPVLERAWAARAGLGFVGKNGLIIAPGLGSFVLLGEVVTTLGLVPDTAVGERCGSCTLCLDACPTSAFAAPFVLDPRRCVSYLTIELRGEMASDLRASVGEHLFGCDVCQDVCPHNRASTSGKGRVAELPKPRYRATERLKQSSLEDLIDLDEEGYRALTEGSALKRATRHGLARNAVNVLATRKQPRHLPLLQRVAREHPDSAVRAHAAWGIELLAESPARGEDL